MIIAFGGCAAPKARLNRPLFPESYLQGSVDPSAVVTVSPLLHVIRLNGDPDRNKTVVDLWKNGSLSEAFRRVQPMSSIYREDVINLSAFLSGIFRIYLAAVTATVPVSVDDLKNQLVEKLRCDPMSNLEVRFLMNTSLSAPFSKKPLSMLLITAHELALQAGADPVYPRVYSPYLRKRNNLPPLKDLEEFNLFATKTEKEVYSTSVTGFIVCQRSPDNHQPKPAGPP